MTSPADALSVFRVCQSRRTTDLNLALHFARNIWGLLNEQKNGRQPYRKLLISIAGGSLPASLASGLFDYEMKQEQLGQYEAHLVKEIVEKRNDIDWTRLVIVPLDERCVDLSSPDCNASSIQSEFQKRLGAKTPQVITLRKDILEQFEADRSSRFLQHALCQGFEEDIQQALGPNPSDPQKKRPFTDIVIDISYVGFGPDGHIASLFPHHPSTLHPESLVSSESKQIYLIEESPKPPPFRITFSMPFIQKSTLICATGCGAEKQVAVNGAVARMLNISEDELAKPPICSQPPGEPIDAFWMEHYDENARTEESLVEKNIILPRLQRGVQQKKTVFDVTIPLATLLHGRSAKAGDTVLLVDGSASHAIDDFLFAK